MDVDVIVVGAGLAGLVAAHELTSAGHRVALLDQENATNLGGQAWWSLGGLFFVDSPEQRRLRVHDSVELAWRDWQASAAFDRLDDEDSWAVRWARAYVEFAAGEKRPWLEGHGIRFLPTVGWAERGGLRADAHGNSIPRFHIAWGTGTGIVRPFADSAHSAAHTGSLVFRHRHRVDSLLTDGAAVVGVAGAVLETDDAVRGAPSSRRVVGDFEMRAQAVVVTSGGIGGNHAMVRKFWPDRLGTPPATMVTGVPEHVDGRMLEIAERVGARLVNRDRMWHYTEGVVNWDPIWPGHGIRILPGPSSMWFDALGRRLPDPCLPGFDTLATLRHLRTTPDIARYDHSWFVLNTRIIAKEFALSGSEQNPDITLGGRMALIRDRVFGSGPPTPVQRFIDQGADFVTGDTVEQLVAKMNGLTDSALLDATAVRRQIEARDAQLDNAYGKDSQIMAIRNSRAFIGERLGRTAALGKILEPDDGPLIGVKLHVLTRKSLGGIQTDLSSRVLGLDGAPIDGLYAAGEAAGFGGGGVHGYNSLEGTFLGGCLYSGRVAGRALADVLGKRSTAQSPSA